MCVSKRYSNFPHPMLYLHLVDFMIEGAQIVLQDASLHGGSHAFNHNHGQQQPQQESLEMEEIQGENRMSTEC